MSIHRSIYVYISLYLYISIYVSLNVYLHVPLYLCLSISLILLSSWSSLCVFQVLSTLQIDHEVAALPDDDEAAAPMEVESLQENLDDVLGAEAKKALKKQKKKDQKSMERFTIKDGSKNGQGDGAVGGIDTTVSFQDKKKRKAELSISEHKKGKKKKSHHD